MKKIFLVVCINFFLAGYVFSQSRVADLNVTGDVRGKPELVICSQNLENYSLFSYVKNRSGGKIDSEMYNQKQGALLNRFIAMKCDVIAVQEILSVNVAMAEKALKNLADQLRFRTNRVFEARTAESNDRRRRLGFLVAKDRAEILNKVSYARIELPKVAFKQRQRMFSRGPMELQIKVRGRGDAKDKEVTLINFHFKSKSTKGGTDPTGLNFEPYRIEMAEALRQICEKRHLESVNQGKQLLVLLGDRNSHSDVASARVLEGALTLRDFQGQAPCRMSERGVPLCKPGVAKPPKFFSVLTQDPQTRMLEGTHRYKNIYSWIDDILLPAATLPFAWTEPYKEGDYDSGVLYKWPEASDHAMVYVTLNW